MADDFILQTHDLTKEFKGFVAVNQVNLNVRRGSIHALIGPNGAGKTTCFNLLTKFLTPTTGRIVFDGTDITGESSAPRSTSGGPKVRWTRSTTAPCSCSTRWTCPSMPASRPWS